MPKSGSRCSTPQTKRIAYCTVKWIYGRLLELITCSTVQARVCLPVEPNVEEGATLGQPLSKNFHEREQSISLTIFPTIAESCVPLT